MSTHDTTRDMIQPETWRNSWALPYHAEEIWLCARGPCYANLSVSLRCDRGERFPPINQWRNSECSRGSNAVGVTLLLHHTVTDICSAVWVAMLTAMQTLKGTRLFLYPHWLLRSFLLLVLLWMKKKGSQVLIRSARISRRIKSPDGFESFDRLSGLNAPIMKSYCAENLYFS